MKKRIFSLALAFLLLFTMIPGYNASAAETNSTTSESSVISQWSLKDLVVGDAYGIYPLSWYNSNMKTSISQGKVDILLAGLRIKILESDCVTDNPDVIYKTSQNMTVEQVLKVYYSLLTTMKYNKELGFDQKTAISNLKKAGIYLGTDGEPKLTDRCSIEAACVYATRIITYVYDKFDAGSKGFLWETKNAGNTVYMLGSIHMASNSIYPMDKKILEAYQSSEALIEELNAFDTSGAMKVAELGVYTDGTTLKDHISEASYKETVTFAEKYGLAESFVSKCKPWYLYISFASLSYTSDGDTSEAQEAAALGIDRSFLIDAYLDNKPVMEVEGYEKQAQVLNGFSDKLAEYLLIQTIDSVNDSIDGKGNDTVDSLNSMLELWHKGDIESFLKSNTIDSEYDDLFTEEDKETIELLKEFNQKLFKQRDEGMANYIDNLLKGEGTHTYFIIVGSGHYVSDYSVLDRLKEKGYQITQIK